MFGYLQRWSIAANSPGPHREWMVRGNPYSIPPLEEVLTVENALAAYESLKARGGPCPGIDRVRYEDVSRADVYECFRRQIPRVLSGKYRPQPVREKVIKKPDGSPRVLKLQVIMDRVLALMICEAIAEYVDRLFVTWSYGFRPRRSPWHMLAAIKIGVESHGLYVLTHDDIRRAFDNVPIRLLLATLECVIPDRKYRELIAAIVVKYDGAGKEVTTGIDQGCALSPMLLNVYLHIRLDTLLSKGGNVPSRRYRYADNIGHGTPDANEGNRLLEETRHLLEDAGLSLKGYNREKPEELLGTPVDLRERASPLLGFNLLVRNDRMLLEVGKKVWEELQQELKKTHCHPNPPARAREVVQGLISSIGPALDYRMEAVTRRITQHLREAYLQGVIPKEELSAWARGSLESWHRTLQEVRENHGGG